MITEHDLREAIAECQGVRDPTANTCIKLSAYYILLDHLYPAETPMSYSFAESPEEVISLKSGSEFSEVVNGKTPDRVFPIIDEMMEILKVTNSRLHTATIDRLRES